MDDFDEYNSPESDWDDLGEMGRNESFEDACAERESDYGMEDQYLDSHYEDQYDLGDY
jgi:hypothetical protein